MKKEVALDARGFRKFGILDSVSYAAGDFGCNMSFALKGTVQTFWLVYMMMETGLLSALLLAVQIWDAINDPMMGTIVDRTRTKWGKCRPYLFFVPAIVMVTTFLTFVNKQYSVANDAKTNTLIIAWAAISYILWGMTYTAGDIPIWGITSLMTESEKDRATRKKR